MKLDTWKKIIAITVLAGGAGFLLASYVSEERLRDTQQAVSETVIEQQKRLTDVADLTGSNQADVTTEGIIRDCKDRTRFEDLLNQLATLTAAELRELSDLFDGCAPFFAEQKAFLVARLERELKTLEMLVALQKQLDPATDVAAYQFSHWNDLVTLEQKRRDIFRQQVDVQYRIIEALQAGQAIGSEPITTALAEAKNISEEATVVNIQIEQVRRTLDL